MKLIRLTKDTIIKSFDCGDADLNDFILNDAKAFLSKRIAYTFLIIDGENIVAYFSLLNDKVAKTDAANNTWRKLRRNFPHEKHFRCLDASNLSLRFHHYLHALHATFSGSPQPNTCFLVCRDMNQVFLSCLQQIQKPPTKPLVPY